jgi:hypothetical protein
MCHIDLTPLSPPPLLVQKPLLQRLEFGIHLKYQLNFRRLEEAASMAARIQKIKSAMLINRFSRQTAPAKSTRAQNH